eukprot:TRINITY_DN11679_c0_g1_i1.p1 TRINITY_DN11679_c0_g1~~TRINITY_DN11679_c0_g1_i1.p1  ORF type:complete len:189 (-),score=58.30 TRINITY_DN11679_c0_g1_i1:64-630(-)
MGNSKSVKNEAKEIFDSYGIPKMQRKEILKTFRTYKKDGVIPKELWIEVLLETGATIEFANALWDTFDRNGDGSLDYKEFFIMSAVSVGGTKEQKLAASFDLFDENNDGYLTKEEVINMLSACYIYHQKRGSDEFGDSLNDEDKERIERITDEIFEKIDIDENGKIDREEFIEGALADDLVLTHLKQF